ncbi:hypothetical protein FHS89_003002 [Rubricella aquisinus]|uniref:Uncharacterized protein n=1 Tax=Rubricella aquisinus TaxID=2028108 RepID=A0A840WPH7_9RHOB|nr:hypothetical protein [Rubricella aquisinus]MBB5516958.1 hypothetical protein [Rubricella aquisinus]
MGKGMVTAIFAAGMSLSIGSVSAQERVPNFAEFGYALDGKMPTPHQFVMDWMEEEAPGITDMILRARQPFGPQSDLGLSFDPDGQSSVRVTLRF